MNTLFECLDTDFFRVPDGTLVNPYLSPKGVPGGLPWAVPDGVSVAAGYLEPGIVSEIHVHPFVTQMTVILSGALDIHMKDPGTSEPRYTRRLALPASTGRAGFTTAATLAMPGTFFQLDNSRGEVPAHVFYLVSPPYVFEPGENRDSPPVYDDAVTVGSDWKRLAALAWNPPELADPARSFSARESAKQRLRSRAKE